MKTKKLLKLLKWLSSKKGFIVEENINSLIFKYKEQEFKIKCKSGYHLRMHMEKHLNLTLIGEERLGEYFYCRK